MCVFMDIFGYVKCLIYFVFFMIIMVMNDNKYWFYFYVGYMLWCDVNLYYICFDYFMWIKKWFCYLIEK